MSGSALWLEMWPVLPKAEREREGAARTCTDNGNISTGIIIAINILCIFKELSSLQMILSY